MDVSARELTAADFTAIAGNLSAATGGAAPHHALQLMRDLADAAGGGAAGGETGADGAAGEARVLAAIEAAIALAPRDPLEGMLIAQMAAVNAAAMRCLGRAAECGDHPQIEALYLREASRLLHLFVRQAEALDRRTRRLGPPKEAGEADGTAAAENAAGTAAAGRAPDGAQVLEKLLAGIYARRRAEASRRTGDGGKGSGDRAGFRSVTADG